MSECWALITIVCVSMVIGLAILYYLENGFSGGDNHINLIDIDTLSKEDLAYIRIHGRKALAKKKRGEEK